MRHLLVWTVLFAVYAATIGLHAVQGSEYAVEEAHHLLTAESLVSDGDVDLSDDLPGAGRLDGLPADLEIHGQLMDGRIHDPHGAGFPLIIAPALAIAGVIGVELLLAAVMALSFVVAAALARVVVPEPWATRGVLAVALSPPVVVHASAVEPDGMAGLLLILAIFGAVRAREDARIPWVAAAGLALAALPWLGPEYLLPGALVSGLLMHWTLRQHRRLAALVAFEIVSTSLIAYTAVNEGLYGGLTPLAADVGHDIAPGFLPPDALLDRAPRLVSLWLDRDYGLIRWAPVLALAVYGIWLLWRSRRDALARMLPERREAESTAGLALGVGACLLLVAAVFGSGATGDRFPGRHLVAAMPGAAILIAWASRHLPRTALALSALTVLTTAWLLVSLRIGADDAWGAPTSSVPWGPLERLLPSYEPLTLWAGALTLVLAAALLVVVTVEWRAARLWRGTADSSRRV